MNPEMEREGSLRWTRRTGQCHDVRFPPLNRVLLLGLVHSLAGGESGPRAEPTCCAPAGHARLRGGAQPHPVKRGTQAGDASGPAQVPDSAESEFEAPTPAGPWVPEQRVRVWS